MPATSTPASPAAPHIRRFLAERTQHLAHAPEVWTLAPVAGAINGRPFRGDGAPR
ncbi:putative antibiotic biosynthesis monooxygenase [Mycobacterium xenopi 3993]|nr:putative antibiotic biosynthesis monooxygenase [Mycobacterium xenopi 3993]